MKLYSKNLNVLIFLFTLLMSGDVLAQSSKTTKQDVYVDDTGVMRWGHNEKEVKGFGVNYSAPFAHGYRTAQTLGVNLKEAIDKDVYHFSRLGFDLYRIHVWDTEISDVDGNLLDNEHLELFDYLLKQLKDRGINFMITPIAYWGSGWPEPDPETPGFSHKFGKDSSLTNPEAIKAQENYLAQFLNHVNPFTGVAYKDEPNIIAFEISNEPHHRGSAEEVTEFVDKMISSMRSTGTKKPIFYNVSHSTHLAQAYFDAEIQGGTFQWYPTGLGFGKELQGNLLPNVNDYDIPFDDVIRENNGAKLVYEFDAADVMKSYMYPAMARSFREAGIQIATQFAYDPTYMAYANTEYDTHYMNLAYTPQKALALMISGEIFHELPMYENTGRYPDNLEFGDFSIDYENDLAELNSVEKFIYTNTTSTRLKNDEKLKQVAGFGNSEVVKYEGKGAYFLDKLEKGVWRLEVMPDAILVDNPFGNNSLKKTIAVINHTSREMNIHLADIGMDFSILGLNEGNEFSGKAEGSKFSIEPGAYLLTRKGVSTKLGPEDEWDQKKLKEFAAPETTVDKTYLMHDALPEISEDTAMEISAEIVSNEEIEKVEVWYQNGNVYENGQLERQRGYEWAMDVPETLLKNGFLKYRIIVYTSGSSYTFPDDMQGDPGEWDYLGEESYTTRVVDKDRPLYLFEANEDSESVVRQWLPSLNVVPANLPGEAEFQVNVEKLFEEDIENLDAAPVNDYSFRYYFRDKIKGRIEELGAKSRLVIKGRALTDNREKLQVALVMKNGASFGKIIELDPQLQEHELDLSTLKEVKTVTLPRPYPSFLPYYFEHNLTTPFDLNEVESLQFSIGPGLPNEELENEHGVGIIHVRLE
ncbi:hypothetical protein GCM10007103_08340 [Salinimicrobium marinum]|uniref:Glycoside hydrolase family 5 domain-containing protein n=1 Tax=Salinimicrobium marinum TaxID=680283 RepID=A0A918S8U5_9FLAO|nr:cellulase family glycosylhydrolase [Salinimicrobium marinum]GHA29454.1 hypothetical protein GCM10007103_08340 [Salinimicrobium marinum]